MKTTRTLFYLTLVVVLFVSCAPKGNTLEPKRTVISGVVKNFTEETGVITVNYCDPLSNERKFAQNLSESNGYFQVEHDYTFSQNLTLSFARKFINIFVHPGDSIFVTIDANEDFKDGITFSGDNSELNKELFLWTDYSYPILNWDIQLEFNSPDELLASLKREFQKSKDSISAYSERENMSVFLKEWAYIDRKYIIANSLIDYYIEHSSSERTWDIFTDPIFDVFNDDNFHSNIFSIHADACMGALSRSDVEINRLISEKAYIPAIRLVIERLHNRAPEGIVREYMLFNYLKGAINQMPEIYDSVPEIKAAFSHDFFKKELEKIVLEKTKVQESAKIPVSASKLKGVLYLADGTPEELSDIKLLTHLAEKHKGKVLYIDVWATWCGPCKEEFNHTQPLHNYFKGKDVVFVYLCLGSNFDAWIPAIEQFKISGEHYFLDATASTLFMGENNLPGYPSYLIIDKNGGIDYSAPRPSNLEAAIKEIERLLK